MTSLCLSRFITGHNAQSLQTLLTLTKQYIVGLIVFPPFYLIADYHKTTWKRLVFILGTCGQL